MAHTVEAELRLHGVVLAVPLGRAVAAGVAGAMLVVAGWPWSALGAVALGSSAAAALRSVWRWERTRIVLTAERIVVRHGTLRRHEASASLRGDTAVEVEQAVLGRLLGYGTVCAGELEVPFVPAPWRVLGGV